MCRFSVAALILLAACAGSPDRPAKTYETRGVIQRLPVAGTPGQEIFIAHEAIPSFESIDGEVTGMDAMSMGFPITDPSLLSGLEVGDKIAFALKVDWQGSPPLEVVSLSQLPADTVLGFEAPAAAGEAHGAGHVEHAEPPEAAAQGHGGHTAPDHEH